MSDQPQSLQSMPAKPKRAGWIVPTVAALAVLALAGVGGTIWFATRSTEPAPVAAATTPATTPSPTSWPAANSNDAVGVDVCLALKIEDSDNPQLMKALGEKAATSQDQSIKLAGMILRDSALLAEMAGGKGPEAVRMVGEAANLMTACLKGGYPITKP